MIQVTKDTEDDRSQLIVRLRELIEALEARVPHLEREGEVQIAGDAAALKAKALERIAQLEKDGMPVRPAARVGPFA
jgi:hypothetical protein